MKKIYISLLGIILVLTSCNDFLNIQPKGQTIPSTYEDYNSLMGYIQLCKGSESYLCHITDDIRFSDGDYVGNYNIQNDLTKRLYSFAHGPLVNEGEDDNLWVEAYYRIYAFNAVINNVMKVTDNTEENKLKLKCQALVGRAYEYLTLISVFSPTYDRTTASTDYGVPLILTEDISKMNYHRNSVSEVYAQIEQDLLYSYQHLPTSSYTTFRPMQASVAGMLSRMYLRMSDYDNALKYANLALSVKSGVTDMKLYSGRTSNGIPNDGIGIVLASDMKTVYPDGDKSVENLYTRYQPQTYQNHRSVYANEDLLEAFKEYLPTGAVDMRRSLYYRDNKWGSFVFPGYTMWGPRYYINMAITTTELMLTAAECYARIGDTSSLSKASALYNKLRNNRIKGNIEVTFSDPFDALKRVLNERRKEFAFVGEIRLVDLKRLNKDPRFAKKVVHTANGENWVLEPNDPRYIFPLPQKLFSFRPDIPDYER